MTQSDAAASGTPDPHLDSDAVEHHEENAPREESHEHHDDHQNAAPTGFATPVMATPAASVQAVLSSDQFRKIDDLLKRTGKLSRRLTLLTLLNFIVLGLLGWSWYNDHKQLVDHYIGIVAPAKSEAPSAAPIPARPTSPAVVAPATAPTPSGPPVRDAANAAAAQKLFDEAKTLESEGNLPDAVAKLESIKFGYASIDWPPGLEDAITSARTKMKEKPQGDFFGVH